MRPRTQVVALVAMMALALIACAGDPFAVPDRYTTYRLTSEGIVADVLHPNSWGDPRVDTAANGMLLTWVGPTEPKYRTAPLLAVALERFPSEELAKCSAYLEKSVHEAAGDTVSAPTKAVSVSGNHGAVVAFTYTVSFASEFGEKVPRQVTRHIACIPTPVQNLDLTIDMQAAENQASIADAVFEKVVSGSSLSAADKPK